MSLLGFTTSETLIYNDASDGLECLSSSFASMATFFLSDKSIKHLPP